MASKLWTPPGTRGPQERAALPVGDVRLSDGRWLRYDRKETLTDGHTTVNLALWFGPKGLKVFGSMDEVPDRGWGPLLHVSLSYADHDPTWADIKAVREEFFGPGVDAMMVLPRPEDYVNLQVHCFHVWQIPEPWGIM